MKLHIYIYIMKLHIYIYYIYMKFLKADFLKKQIYLLINNYFSSFGDTSRICTDEALVKKTNYF